MGYGDPNVTNHNNTTNVANQTDAEALIKFAKSRTEPVLVQLEDPHQETPSVPVMLAFDKDGAADAYSLKSCIDEYRVRPVRRTGTITVSTIESFVALVNRDSTENSVIFADNGSSPKLTAVLNFHHADNSDPEFCDNKVVYPFPLSDEWKAWTAKNGEKAKMSQADFAEFIEDRYFDIAEPGSAGQITATWAERMGVKLAGPSELMRVSRGLSVRVEETVRNVVKRESGESDFVFTVEHKDSADGGSVKVPSAFHIRIPILRGEGDYSIPVRLRYRVGGGKVAWFYELHRPELFLLDAVNDAIARVKAPEDADDEAARGCGLLVVMGNPPA